MAGIGFELRRLLRQDSYLGLLRAYSYAGIIGSGPWVLSILAVMALGMISASTRQGASGHVTEFLVSVTWLVAASLIFTGLVQLLFTRFVADRLFEHHAERVLPNLFGLLTLVTLAAGTLGLAAMPAFAGTGVVYRLEMAVAFVLLSNIWCVAVFVAGVKAYHQVLGAFALGYGATLGAGLLLRDLGLEGLLGGFVLGQGLLLYCLLFMVIRHYPSERLWAFDLHRRGQRHLSLILIGLSYNLGIWVDQAGFLVQSRHIRVHHRPAACRADSRPPALPRLPLHRPRHGRVPDAHGDGLRRALQRLLRGRPRRRYPRPYRAAARSDDHQRTTRHLRYLQGSGHHHPGPADGRPDPARLARLLGLVSAAVQYLPGGGRHPGAVHGRSSTCCSISTA